MKTFALALTVASLLLSGCNATMPQAAGDFGKSASGFVRNAITPDVYTNYKGTLEQERATLAKAINGVDWKLSGQPANTTAWLDKEVRYHRGGQVWAVNATRDFRLAVPADAVEAKHKAAESLIESFTKYSLTRADKSGIVVTAPSAAERSWMAGVARKAGASQVEERAEAYTSIGWASIAFQEDRNVQ